MNTYWVLAGVSAAGAFLTIPANGWVRYRVVGGPPRRDREPRWLGRRRPRTDAFAVAATFDMLAVCLRGGLPIGSAAAVVEPTAPPELRPVLLRAADLLALGADPAQAWATPDDASDSVRALTVMARRSARGGSSLMSGLAELAAKERAAAADRAAASAERAGVAISGPLGLCFLPAFVCLGIVPVVIGLAGTALSGGVL